MRRNHPSLPAAALAAMLAAPLLTAGCVQRVHEAPGLTPDSPWAVGSDMRVERFEVGESEVRAFRLPASESDVRRYEFIVLKDGYETARFYLERLDDGGWALMEHRSDGISASRGTWPSEPAYQTVRSEVVRLVRERDVRSGV